LTTDPPGPFASTILSAGTAENVGPVLSVTVTVKLAVPEFPAASIAEQLTVVVPIAKVVPDAGTQFGVNDPETLSDALAEKLTLVPEAESASTLMFDGTVTVGFVVSWTVIVNEMAVSVVLPLASWAVQLTMVFPSGKTLPEDGAQLTLGDGSPLSLALGAV
jgi:hypothetical protein